MDSLLTMITSILGYAGSPAYIEPGGLQNIDATFRSSVDHAFQHCGVKGVFGLATHGAAFVPITYVAAAADAAAARKVHGSIWTQGTVPFAVIVTPDGVWSCDAFAPPSLPNSSALLGPQHFIEGSPPPPAFSHLTSRSLRVSLARPDRPAAQKTRVDERLLANLRRLARALAKAAPGTPSIGPTAANALIGRLLFLRFLQDRGVLPGGWIPKLPDSGGQRPAWLQDLWASLSRADRVFNGSVFPIQETDRDRISADQAALAFSVIITDADLTEEEEREQLSFSEFRFASLRTETLSAVYELFFELSDPGRKSEDGAIYTPPFLADHVLQKVAAVRPFGQGDRVLDCAAGSGIFLVGALRQIVEAALPTGSRRMSLQTLHRLLRTSIWGVEKNGDACHVAALSLYLTMLDYAEPGDIRDIIQGRPAGRRVFPELVGRNLLCKNFFDPVPTPNSFPKRFEFVVTNPPWTTVSSVGEAAEAYAAAQSPQITDSNRAAPIFLHKAISRHLAQGGVFGVVMSARAIVSSSARRFPEYLLAQTGLNACSNLSSLRRTLFLGAEHPAVVLVGQARREDAGGVLTVFNPNQILQPLARDGRHWVLIEDSSERRSFRRDQLRTADDLIDALMLTTADHRFSRWVSIAHHSRRMASLGDLVDALKLTFSRGGTGEETGVPARYVLNAAKGSPLEYRVALRRVEGPPGHPEYQVPRSVAEQAKPTYRRLFGGNTIMVPRSGAECFVVEEPFAFNSSFYGIATPGSSPSDLGLLKRLADYLNSDFAKYCFAVQGRDWALDRRRLERQQMALLPVPASLRDPGGDEWSTELGSIVRGLRLPSYVTLIVEEFTKHRSLLMNGRRPDQATRPADLTDRRAYERALEDELGGHVSRTSGYIVRSNEDPESGTGAVAARYLSEPVAESTRVAVGGELEAALGRAASVFVSSGATLVGDSSWLMRLGTSGIALVKPLSRLHWTVDRAVEDAAMILRDALANATIPDR